MEQEYVFFCRHHEKPVKKKINFPHSQQKNCEPRCGILDPELQKISKEKKSLRAAEFTLNAHTKILDS
jgi:hypothetical protein